VLLPGDQIVQDRSPVVPMEILPGVASGAGLAAGSNSCCCSVGSHDMSALVFLREESTPDMLWLPISEPIQFHQTCTLKTQQDVACCQAITACRCLIVLPFGWLNVIVRLCPCCSDLKPRPRCVTCSLQTGWICCTPLGAPKRCSPCLHRALFLSTILVVSLLCFPIGAQLVFGVS